MLEINPEIVCNIIQRAREFHAKEVVHIPEEPPEKTDDWYEQVLSDYAEDDTLQEVMSTIKDLEPIQQASIVALFWIGRGDFEVQEWNEALAEARRNWTDATAEYLLTKPMVADYLEEALNKMGFDCNG